MIKSFLKLFGPAILVYGLNFMAVATGVYGMVPWFDSVMHFSGGVAMAMLAYGLWGMGLGLYDKKVMDSIPVLIQVITVIGFVSFIGVAWEWHEFLIDQMHLRNLVAFIPMQPGIGDTMKDLFLDILGATLYSGAMTFVLRRK
ncbi:MAG: hypothetical protein WC813_01990 [Patescibacteria group bacterium]|jgi:hypothetical protein